MRILLRRASFTPARLGGRRFNGESLHLDGYDVGVRQRLDPQPPVLGARMLCSKSAKSSNFGSYLGFICIVQVSDEPICCIRKMFLWIELLPIMAYTRPMQYLHFLAVRTQMSERCRFRLMTAVCCGPLQDIPGCQAGPFLYRTFLITTKYPANDSVRHRLFQFGITT